MNRSRGVVDCFCGTGTTIIAAEKLGKIGYGIEIDPKYVDVIVKRWQDFTGQKAIHAETGEAFDG
jgi:DNA modification methylase